MPCWRRSSYRLLNPCRRMRLYGSRIDRLHVFQGVKPGFQTIAAILRPWPLANRILVPFHGGGECRHKNLAVQRVHEVRHDASLHADSGRHVTDSCGQNHRCCGISRRISPVSHIPSLPGICTSQSATSAGFIAKTSSASSARRLAALMPEVREPAPEHLADRGVIVDDQDEPQRRAPLSEVCRSTGSPAPSACAIRAGRRDMSDLLIPRHPNFTQQDVRRERLLEEVRFLV